MKRRAAEGEDGSPAAAAAAGEVDSGGAGDDAGSAGPRRDDAAAVQRLLALERPRIGAEVSDQDSSTSSSSAAAAAAAAASASASASAAASKPSAIATEAAAWEDAFGVVADRLLNGAELVIKGVPHRVVEIEAYLKTGTADQDRPHPDPFVHGGPHQQQHGQWYFHRYGQGFKGGTYKGLDIAFSDRCGTGVPAAKRAAAGFLVRAIETPSGDLVEGSCRVVDHILAKVGSADLVALHARKDFDVRCSREVKDDVLYLREVVPAAGAGAGAAGAAGSGGGGGGSGEDGGGGVQQLKGPLGKRREAGSGEGSMPQRVVRRTPRVGLSLRVTDDAEERRKYVGRLYRYVTRSDKIVKGRVHAAITMRYHAPARTAAAIAGALGTKDTTVRTWLDNYDKGANGTVKPTRFAGAKSLSVADTCTLLGGILAAYGSPPGHHA